MLYNKHGCCTAVLLLLSCHRPLVFQTPGAVDVLPNDPIEAAVWWDRFEVSPLLHSVIAGLETLKVPLTAQSLFTKGAYSS